MRLPFSKPVHTNRSFVLFDLILYGPSTIFQLYRDSHIANLEMVRIISSSIKRYTTRINHSSKNNNKKKVNQFRVFLVPLWRPVFLCKIGENVEQIQIADRYSYQNCDFSLRKNTRIYEINRRLGHCNATPLTGSYLR